MSDLAEKIWQSFRLATAEPEHPMRRLVEEHRRLKEANEKFLQLAREHGEQRDAAVREKVAATQTAQRLSGDLERLRGFAQAVMADWPEFSGLDGFQLQELAVEHGLLKKTDDPIREPCCDDCFCARYYGPDELRDGVDCYRRTPLLKGE